MVVTQLWATQQKRLQSQPRGRIWFGPKSNFWVRQFREKHPKVFANHWFFLKIFTMKFWLIWARSELSKCQNSLLSLIISDTSVSEYICMFLKRMIWHVVCVAALRPALHGQSVEGRRMSCNLLHCSNHANSFNLSQNILMTNMKCRHIFWVWKSFNSYRRLFHLHSMGFLFKVSGTPECHPMCLHWSKLKKLSMGSLSKFWTAF